jgi:sugar phosphate isomerase/epimerase
MRLSVITDEISQDVSRALMVMAEYGCTDAELRNVYGSYIVDADEETLTRVEKDLKAAGFPVSCLDTPLFKCELEGIGAGGAGPTHGAKERTMDEQMSLLQHSIDLCKRFDTPFIRIFSFWRRGPLTPEIEERVATALVPACEVAQRAGITLLLENEHACYFGTGKETARLIERIGSPALKMIWDPGNAFMAGEQPFPAGYAAARPHLAHVHIKDARADGDRLEWVAVGQGDIDYAGQFRALTRDGYSGAVSLETHYRAANGDAEQSSRECLEGMTLLLRESADASGSAS